MNKVWAALLLIGILAAAGRWLNGDTEVLQAVVDSSFSMAKLSVEIAIGLVGLLALWSGLFRIAEQAGLVRTISRALAPLFSRLMPEVPAGHPAQGAITMNLAANMLGLDNAATPLGIRAMQSLQSLNPLKDTASNAQILFLVLNTSSVTLLPVTIFMYRAQAGAVSPTDVFVPILLATTASTMAGVLAVMAIQRIRMDAVVIAWLAGLVTLIAGFVYWLGGLPIERLSQVSSGIANSLLLTVIALFLIIGLVRRVRVYDEFIEGAKSGFETAVMLIPYLVAMLVAIGVFRAGGALDGVVEAIAAVLGWFGINTAFVDALPVAFMKPFSGSGSRAMMLETIDTLGVDSLAGRIAAIMQGSTETTFYVLTVYFGVVGITRMRYALWAGLLCDAVGITTAIIVGMWFFG